MQNSPEMFNEKLQRIKTRLNAIANKYKRYPPTWPFIIGSLLIIAGIIYPTYGRELAYSQIGLDLKQVSAFLKELGFAFIISFVVAWLIEANARREYIQFVEETSQQLSVSIYEFLYNVNLPPKVFKLIEENLFKEQFMRENLKITYHVNELNSDDISKNVSAKTKLEMCASLLIFDVEVSYVVKNISGYSGNFPGAFTVEKELKEFFNPNSLVAKTGLLSLNIDGKYFNLAALNKTDKLAPDDERNKNFTFPIPLEAGQSKLVCLSYRMIKRKSDKELYRMLFICDSLTFAAHYPKSIRMIADPVLPLKQQTDKNLLYSEIDDGFIQCVISHPIFPGNGILMWWEPK
ncbi:MAG: hypothetical protein HYX37_21095 [Rhizobiales bacterium]|nr:hypothetical protein [Hyphomicrobiales bacterium]